MESNNDILQALQSKIEPDCHFLRSLLRNQVNLNISILGKALQIAIENGFFNSVRILLEAGASPNTRLIWNKTPLHICFKNKHGTAILRELLQHGADVNAEDCFKETPLHEASQNQCVENMQELLKNGATVDAVEFWGLTPLHFGIGRNSHPEVSTVQVLLNAGANVNLCDEIGWSPLHSAIARRSPHIVQLLLRHKADANIRNNRGDTPLHHTLRDTGSTIELIRELLKGGARVNELNINGHSPLYCSIEAHNVDATRELLRCGAAFDIVECFEALERSFRQESHHEVIAISQELIRYLFMRNKGPLKGIRRHLMHKRVVRVLRRISSPECNLENFKYACLSEVDALSKMSCECGKSSIWGRISNCEECTCDTDQVIIKFLFSGRKSNFVDAFFYKLSEEFLLEVTLNLVSYFEFKECKKRVMLNGDCMKEIEPYVSLEEIVSFLQCKQSEMDDSEFEKFQEFMRGVPSVKSSSEISSPDPKRLRVS